MKVTVPNTVRNPLTVIAIFAGISEVAMTVTLTCLPESSQKLFIWFVMLFPVLLVAAFFYVLYKKPASLFSPSDYKEDETYLSSIADEKSLQEFDRRLQRVEEVNQTLQTYLENVVKEVSPEGSEAIISKQQERLEFIRKIHNLESNRLYLFLNREIGMAPDAIIELVGKVTSAPDLSRLVHEATASESARKRVDRIIHRFPRVLGDLEKLKDQIGV